MTWTRRSRRLSKKPSTSVNTPTKRFCLKTLLLLLLLGLLYLPALADETDYAVRHQPGEKTGTRLMEATVRTFVDGDTTHFSVPEDQFPGRRAERPLSGGQHAGMHGKGGTLRTGGLRLHPGKALGPPQRSCWNRIRRTGSWTPPASGRWSGCGTSLRKGNSTAT